MDAGKLALIERVAEALDRGDVKAMTALTTPDVVADWSESRGPFARAYEGRDAVLGLFTEMAESIEVVSWEITDRRELDEDRVLVTNTIHGRGRGSGAEITATGAAVWTLRDDGVAGIKLFQSREDALAALGIDQ